MNKYDIKLISDPLQLESIGQALAPEQLLAMLDQLPKLPVDHRWKLAPILAYVHHDVFVYVLQHGTEAQLEVLKAEAYAEPVQYHLMLLTNSVGQQIYALDTQLVQYENDLKQLDLQTAGHHEIAQLETRIAGLQSAYQEVLHHIERGLPLIWRSKRPDLLERLSFEKEHCQRALLLSIGRSTEPSGLYALLEEKLQAVYGDPDDPNDVEALRDSDPATEALPRLGAWDQKTQKRLASAGLSTIKDLKQARIFSKRSLEEYLSSVVN